MPELLCQSKVKELLEAGINYQEHKTLVSYLNSQTDAPIWDDALRCAPELRERFWYALADLNRELVPHHIGMEDLYTKVWSLFREVILNKVTSQSNSAIDERIDKFSSEVKRPLVAFDVIYHIRNLDIGTRNLTAGHVEFFRLKKEFLHTYEAMQDELLTKLIEQWEGRIVAKVALYASDTRGANTLGKTEIEKALNTLRLGVRKLYIDRSSDSLFLWETGNSLVLSKAGRQFSVHDNKDIYPFIADVGSIFEKLLDENSIWNQLLNSRLPKDIQIRVERAIEWISLAIMEQSVDHKLVHLCTTLEVLLLPDHHNGRKGEPIALRQALLGQGVSQAPTSVVSQGKMYNDLATNDCIEIIESLH